MSGTPIRVVIAAGGLGTRVSGWAQLLPKEFQPLSSRPALVVLLEELAGAGAEQAVLVYHRYYEPFIRWAARALGAGGTGRYRAAAGLPAIPPPAHEGLRLRFVRQHGTYADITSVLNGAAHLPAGPLYVAYADNLYPQVNALALLAAVPGDTAVVLARPFHPGQASQRGVIITNEAGLMSGLAEKPGPGQVTALLAAHGPDRLRLLEGRFRITPRLLDQLRTNASGARPGEPRLSLALAAHARNYPVHVVTTTSPVVDLGSPAAAATHAGADSQNLASVKPGDRNRDLLALARDCSVPRRHSGSQNDSARSKR